MNERLLLLVKEYIFLFNKKLFNLNCKMKLRIALYERVSMDIIPSLWIRSSSAIPNTGEKEILVSNGSKKFCYPENLSDKYLLYLLKMICFYLVLSILRKLSKNIYLMINKLNKLYGDSFSDIYKLFI